MYSSIRIQDPGIIVGGAANVQAGNLAVSWIYLIYLGGLIKVGEHGYIEEFDRKIDMFRGRSGFAYVRFENYPKKFALVSFKPRYYSGKDLETFEQGKKELKKLVGKVDVEIETEKQVTLEDIRRHAEKRVLEGNNSLIEYLERLLQKLDD